MQFILSQTEANRLEGLTTIVSIDRPVIQCVNLTFAVKDQEVLMTATATDSYRAAQHYFTLPRPAEQSEGAEIVLPEDRLVDGKGLREILKKARKNATVHLKFSDDTLEVRVFAGGVNTATELKSEDFDFPKVQQFIDELPWNSSSGPTINQAEHLLGIEDAIDLREHQDVIKDLVDRLRVAEATAAFNPTYLSQVPTMLGIRRGSGNPIRMVLNGESKPAGFRVFEGSEVTAVGVLMAVRV